MTEHICSTCRWWVKNGDADPVILAWGSCALAEERDTSITNDRVYESPKHCEKHSCWNGLSTRSDFGCNQWEEKE